MTDDLVKIYESDIARFREEISLYKDTKHLWEIPAGVKNSAGTIALHLIGNLKLWIGHSYGQQWLCSRQGL